MQAGDWGLAEFLAELFHDSRVHVAALAEFTPDERRNAVSVLIEFEQANRADLPQRPPPLCEATALWGAERFYRGCQFLVFRDASVEAITVELATTCPANSDPASAAYSVDLTWRFLPDLLKLAGGLASDDPLLTHLRQRGVEWPLSSVGVPNLGEVRVDGFFDDSCLRSMYTDRIIARGDVARLNDKRVQDAVREALGAFPELAPEISSIVLKPEKREN